MKKFLILLPIILLAGCGQSQQLSPLLNDNAQAVQVKDPLEEQIAIAASGSSSEQIKPVVSPIVTPSSEAVNDEPKPDVQVPKGYILVRQNGKWAIVPAVQERPAEVPAQDDAANQVLYPGSDGGSEFSPTHETMCRGCEARLRAQPGTNAPIIEQLPNGTHVKTEGAKRFASGLDWRFVRLQDGKSGYVAKALLRGL